MANQLAERPWIIDTPGATVLFAGRMKIDHFLFAGYAADTDNVTVTDANGHVIWVENGASDLHSIGTRTIGWVNGLIVPTLTSGKLYIYFD